MLKVPMVKLLTTQVWTGARQHAVLDCFPGSIGHKAGTDPAHNRTVWAIRVTNHLGSWSVLDGWREAWMNEWMDWYYARYTVVEIKNVYFWYEYSCVCHIIHFYNRRTEAETEYQTLWDFPLSVQIFAELLVSNEDFTSKATIHSREIR